MADDELMRLRNLQRTVKQQESDRREKAKLKAELEPSFFQQTVKVIKGIFENFK